MTQMQVRSMGETRDQMVNQNVVILPPKVAHKLERMRYFLEEGEEL